MPNTTYAAFCGRKGRYNKSMYIYLLLFAYENIKRMHKWNSYLLGTDREIRVSENRGGSKT